MSLTFSRPLAGKIALVVSVALLAIGVAGIARAESHDIQHQLSDARTHAHNSSVSGSVGQSVSQGQTIAAVGCTGHCFGDHVHFEVRLSGGPVDPMSYL